MSVNAIQNQLQWGMPGKVFGLLAAARGGGCWPHSQSNAGVVWTHVNVHIVHIEAATALGLACRYFGFHEPALQHMRAGPGLCHMPFQRTKLVETQLVDTEPEI